MNEIKVSICCLVYNHEKYLRKCLDGFVMQKTNFAYEVIIHDDASTDRSADIIREYEKEYPDIIKPIYQTENQYSLGIKIGDNFVYPVAQGKYIALCEGDDYWCDEEKLQKQFDEMEKNPQAVLCTAKVRCVEENGEWMDLCFPRKKILEKNISSDTMMKLMVEHNSYPFQTSSYFYKKDVRIQMLKEKPKFVTAANVGDVPLLLYMATKGEIVYIDSIMSCYRIGSVDSWNKKNNSKNKKILQAEIMIATYILFDVYTKRLYHSEIEKMIISEKYWINKVENNYKEMCKKEYKDKLNEERLKQKIFYKMNAFIPGFKQIYYILKQSK